MEQIFKLSIFYAWNILNIDSKENLVRVSSTPSLSKSRQDKNRRISNSVKNRPIINEENQDMDMDSDIAYNFFFQKIWRSDIQSYL